MKTKRGFTLIELLVAATIIAVLTAVGFASYSAINKRGRDTKRRGDIEQIRSALEIYRADTGSYPGAGSGSWTNASDLAATLVSSYMPAIPADPKSTQTYRYQATNLSSGKYYGYCVSALIEADVNPADTCTPDTVNSHNYGAKSP